jgi:hypothetical protein
LRSITRTSPDISKGFFEATFSGSNPVLAANV